MTLTELQNRLTLYLDAEKTVLEGNQAVTVPDGTVFTKGNLYHLQREIIKIRHEIAIAKGGTFGAHTFVLGGRR